jgi:hypothetical protein
MIRILSEPVVFFTHFINNATVKCLEDDCPICQVNRQMIQEHPEDYKKYTGFNPWRKMYFVNILDRTVVKTCEKCGYENKSINGQFMPTCVKCQTFITNTKEESSNKVKIWGFGTEIKDQLVVFDTTILDSKKNPLGLKNFDIQLFVNKTGERKQDKKVIPLPMVANNDVVEVDKESLFDLTRAVITLTISELQSLQKGISIRDIFTARNAVSAESSSEGYKQLGLAATEANETVKNAVEDLFKN